MMQVAAEVTDAEVDVAAAYFASLKPQTFVKVVESATAPKSFVIGGMLAALGGKDAGPEPIGQRIIEVPVDLEQAEHRDPRSPFIAYAPPGSLNKGLDLVATGGGKTVACTICHGGDLKGLGNVPPLAGRSPSYVIRQLYDMQHGARLGSNTALMTQVVAKLSDDDMIAIAAYLASVAP
jgi:cytochrome c553